jgi:hypothetical protein
MAPEQPIPVQLEPQAAAAYVHEMAIALARFARANRLPELAYFLEMAAIVAMDRSGVDAGYEPRTD